MAGYQLIATLLLLHGLEGREILLNADAITSMHAAIPGKSNQNVAEPVRCVVNTSDGKFVSVIETCGEIRKLLEGEK